MRRSIVLATLTATLTLLALPARAADTTKETHPLTARQGVVLTGVCGFPVQLDERGGLVVTTTFDASKTPIRYDITGSQTTLLTNLANGKALLFGTIGRTTIVPNADGTATVTQAGSGLAIDQGLTSGDPTLAWFTGTVSSTGVLDAKTLLLEVASQRRVGLSSDICEMLVSGLKTRH
jgi:hypothetical protein